MGRAQEQQGPSGTGETVCAEGARTETERETEVQGAGVQERGLRLVGKELQCVKRRLAGVDPLCDATMRAVRDGLVWVGGCDETDQRRDAVQRAATCNSKTGRCVCARMYY
jgi:hypothetical protein